MLVPPGFDDIVPVVGKSLSIFDIVKVAASPPFTPSYNLAYTVPFDVNVTVEVSSHVVPFVLVCIEYLLSVDVTFTVTLPLVQYVISGVNVNAVTPDVIVSKLTVICVVVVWLPATSVITAHTLYVPFVRLSNVWLSTLFVSPFSLPFIVL